MAIEKTAAFCSRRHFTRKDLFYTMSNEKADLFLDTWRRLETLAERIVGPDEHGGSSVLRLCRDPRFAQYRERLDYCREVRNLLSHEAKVEDEYAVIPSDAMQRMLEEIVTKIEDPPRVTEVMTPVERMLTVKPGSPVLGAMRRMRAQGLSHVPVLDSARVIGIFSVETVFQAVLDGECRVDENTTIAAFTRYLPSEGHMGQDYRFISKSATVATAESIFDRAYDRNRKLKLLLVTRDGTDSGALLGVLTPYDLLGPQ